MHLSRGVRQREKLAFVALGSLRTSGELPGPPPRSPMGAAGIALHCPRGRTVTWAEEGWSRRRSEALWRARAPLMQQGYGWAAEVTGFLSKVSSVAAGMF